MSQRERAMVWAQAGLLLISVTLVAATSRSADWPLGLFAALGIGTILTAQFPIEVKRAKANGSSIGLVLCMTLLGPAPAVVVGVLVMLIQGLRLRQPKQSVLSNAATFAVFCASGGFLMRLADSIGATQHEFGLSVAVFVVFLITNFINFAVVCADFAVIEGRSFRRDFQDLYLPVVPVEIASALLTASMAVVYSAVGLGIAVMLGVVALVFQYLLHLTFVARRRGEQLEGRTEQLASLQVGLISTMLKTLAVRDHMTARHSAAVARYSKAMAEALGLEDDEVELIHTAALFHDIGKFIFPDSILMADRRLTDEEFVIVRRHPIVGAELISEIDGYGPVAEIVRHHHERIDGMGYPDRISGEAIPLGSRIIAVADVYDVITARDTYRKPVSVTDAFAELRRSAGTQLDVELVELFIGLVESEGVMFRHSTAADFEAELALEHRVRDYAAPRIAA